MVLGPGCLNFTVGLSLTSYPELEDVALSFRAVLERVAAALNISGVTLEGGTDLALNGMKVSGNAQRRGRHALIHHGTLLYAFDSSLATRYLKDPRRQPSYRAGRQHRDFIGNLPLSRDALERCLAAAWHR